MNLPLSLHAYRLTTGALAPFSGALLSWRLSRGKEDAERLDERLGLGRAPRPPGSLIWIHGASVGEAISLLPLIERLTQTGRCVLVTTGTVTSASLLATRLPAGAFHQFVPLDVGRFLRRFIAHWRPQALLLAESELWPNLIIEASAAGIPIALVNARMSARSFARWSRAARFIGALLTRVNLCLAQSDGDAQRLRDLGAPNLAVVGNLKYDAPAPPADPHELAKMAGLTSGRQIWIAASTHEGEEAVAIAAHRIVARAFPDVLTLIAPRHPTRAATILEQVEAAGLAYAQRSRGQAPNAGASVFLCDTIGELGLFYRLAGVVFLGKSVIGEGGQNPIEPAKLASAILHGPNVSNFVDVYAKLDAAGGAAIVRDAQEIARTLATLFSDGAALRSMARAAARVVDSQTGAIERTMNALRPYLAVDADAA